MKLSHLVKIYSTGLFLIGISFIFFLLRLPSLVEPYWYGDEGIYEVVGMALRHGRMLYSGIWDNKPPLLYFVYALFNGDQESVRFFSLLVGIATVIVFFLVAKKLLKSITAVYVSVTAFALLFGLPLLEGNIANAENFMLLPAGLSVLIMLKLIEKKVHGVHSYRPLFLAGLLLGISLLFKVVAVFDFAALFLFFFIATYVSFQEIRKQVVPLAMLSAGFFLPLFVTFLTSALFHNLGIFLHSAFLSNVGYVGYGNYFLFPQGLLILKLLLLLAAVVTLFVQRKQLSETYIFILLWLSFSIFNALFSQRPYTHYLLVLLPSFCLLLGLIVLAKKRTRTILATTAVVIVIAFLTVFSFRPQFVKTFGYYANYLSFTSGNKTADNYLGFFDQATVRDYKLAEFINAYKKPGDSLFVWGNNGQLYKLTNMLPAGKYIVAYHITSSQQTWQETATALSKNPPTFIVVLPHQGPIPISLKAYRVRIAVNGGMLYEKIF